MNRTDFLWGSDCIADKASLTNCAAEIVILLTVLATDLTYVDVEV
jgi:hypothetical protein